MQALSGLFGGTQQPAGASGSILGDWNRYNDEPSPSLAGVGSAEVLSNMEEGATRLTSFMSTSFQKVSTSVGENTGGLQRSITTTAARFQVPSGQQIGYFFCFLGTGVFFLVMAFSLFLPMIILTPAKFAFAFSLGSVLILSAFASLRGWQQQLEHMLSSDRLPFSIGYMGTVAATLYVALFMHSYVFTLVCCVLQVVALVYYFSSYFPGGVEGARYILRFFWQSVTACFTSVFGAVAR